MNLDAFRAKVRQYRRNTGYSQQNLAAAIGLHPTVLSSKLNGTDQTTLTHPEIKSIIQTLVAWEAITTQSQALELLALADLRPTSFSSQEWQTPPLKGLELAPATPTLPPSIPAKPVKPEPPVEITLLSALPQFEEESAPRHNLPAQLSPMVGRRDSLNQLRHLLQRADVRLVTLTGAGGMGKTRLALEVGWQLVDDFEHGVFLVELASLHQPALVCIEIARVLGLKEEKNRPPLEQLKNLLRSRRMLLILDNFEQVLEAAPQVAELLAAAPGLKVVVTSRSILHLYGEHEYSVAPLALPQTNRQQARNAGVTDLAHFEAVQLFLQVARTVSPGFILTAENAQAVCDICSLLEGVPLALELAAARLKLFSPVALLNRLGGSKTANSRSNSLRLLNQTHTSRHQTLQNTLEWSFKLLSPAERQLFSQLAVFVGSFTLEAAEAVIQLEDGTSEPVLDGLISLLDKSMLRRETSPTDDFRFSLLSILREYALEKSSQSEGLEQRYADYYLALTVKADPELTGPHQKIWLDRLEQEHDNIRAALNWFFSADNAGAVESGLRMVVAVWWLWYARGYLSEGRTWLELALRRAAETGFTEPNVQAKILSALGSLTMTQGDLAMALNYSQEALELKRAGGNKAEIAAILSNMGILYQDLGDLATSRDYHEQSLALRREVGNKASIAISLANLGIVLKQLGDFERALDLQAESLTIRREIGDKRGIAITLSNLGVLAKRRGNYLEAKTYLKQAWQLQQELGNWLGMSRDLGNLGSVYLEEQNWEEARPLLRQSLRLQRQLGSRRDMAESLFELGRLAQYEQDYNSARTLFDLSLKLRIELNNPDLIKESQQALDELGQATRLSFDKMILDLAQAQPFLTSFPEEPAQPTIDQLIDLVLKDSY